MSEERAIYHAALEQHLAKSGHRDPDAQQMWVNVIETTLTDFMRRHYMGEISSIYQLSKVDLFNAAVQHLMLNEEMIAENEATEGKLLRAMGICLDEIIQFPRLEVAPKPQESAARQRRKAGS